MAAYVKNDHLGFTIPYVHQGRSHDYIPDFLVRLEPRDDEDLRTLIVEVSGSQKSPGPTRQKAETTREPQGAPRSTTTAASAAGATSR